MVVNYGRVGILLTITDADKRYGTNFFDGRKHRSEGIKDIKMG
jgi:hypothetical protein